MDYLKEINQKKFSESLKKAKEILEEVTGEKIDKTPKIQFFYPSLEERIAGLAGFRDEDTIAIAIDFKDEKEKYYTFYHEFFHWAVHQRLKKEYILDKVATDYPLTIFFIRLIEEAEANKVHHPTGEKIKSVFNNKTWTLNLKFMEEGACNFFAGMLISKNESEIPKNMFLFLSVKKEKYISAIKKVYSTLYSVNEVLSSKDIDNILALFDEFSKYSFYDTWTIKTTIGSIITLLAYEVYKRDGKNAKQLLKALINSPLGVVEEVVKEVKKDKKEELLRNAVSDISNEFAHYIR